MFFTVIDNTSFVKIKNIKIRVDYHKSGLTLKFFKICHNF